jgi:F-type H+-transporting ATPase subunit delta
MATKARDKARDDHPDPGHDGVAARNRLARVYAEALMAAAEDAGQVDDVGGELEAVVRGVLDADPGVEAFLASPAVGRQAKTEALGRAFGDRASPLVRNLLGVLNKNGRLGLVRTVAAAYRDLLDQRAGRVRVRVATAVPLTDEQRDRLTNALAARLDKTPVLSATVDPELLGGLVVRVGDQVFDTSVRTRLETLRAQLLEQGSSYVRSQD